MMISFIIKCYLTILLCVGIGAVFIFAAGLYFILRPRQAVSKSEKTLLSSQLSAAEQQAQSSITITSHDLTAIAGDDVLATQLDLARAYIETGRKTLAKKILDHVAQQGSDAQQQEARTLLGII